MGLWAQRPEAAGGPMGQEGTGCGLPGLSPCLPASISLPGTWSPHSMKRSDIRPFLDADQQAPLNRRRMACHMGEAHRHAQRLCSAFLNNSVSSTMLLSPQNNG